MNIDHFAHEHHQSSTKGDLAAENQVTGSNLFQDMRGI